MALREHLSEEMKAAMRSRDKDRLGAIRLILAAIKQREVDERIELDDSAVISVLDKMLKQRRDSLQQYQDAGRDDLAAREAFEIEVIGDYMPAALSEAEIDAAVEAALHEVGASSMKEMGQVMKLLTAQLQGRADMAAVSARIKARLQG